MDHKSNLSNKIEEIISKKILPYQLDKKEEITISRLSSQFSYDLLLECVDIGISTYFNYDENGCLTRESVTNFLEKLGGIAYNKSRSPIEQKILHLKNAGKLNKHYWNDKCADKLLHSYVSELIVSKMPESKILDELNGKIMTFTKQSRNWTEWSSTMTKMIEDVKQQIETNINILSDATVECF